MSPRQLQADLNAMERIDPDRPDGFPRMRCNPELRSEAANDRAIQLGGTPENIRMTIERQLKGLQ